MRCSLFGVRDPSKTANWDSRRESGSKNGCKRCADLWRMHGECKMGNRRNSSRAGLGKQNETRHHRARRERGREWINTTYVFTDLDPTPTRTQESSRLVGVSS